MDGRGAMIGTGACRVMLVAAVLTGLVGSAQAGEYRAQVCRDGLGVGGDGRLSYRESREAFRRSNDCDGPAAEGAKTTFPDRGSVRNGGYAQWIANENVAELRAESISGRICGKSRGGFKARVLAALSGPKPQLMLGRASGDGFKRFRYAHPEIEGLIARLVCTRARCSGDRDPFVAVKALTYRLSDDTAPRVSPQGAWLSRDSKRGVVAIGFRAEDNGGGVAEYTVQVNGRALAAGETSCKLAPSGDARGLQPCPEARSASVLADTAAAPFRQGINRVRICAGDFAQRGQGNHACAVRRILVDNRCPIVGDGVAGIRARFADGRQSKTVRYGRRVRAFGVARRGDGELAAGAELCVGERPTLPGASEFLGLGTTTSAAGRFALRLRSGPSRQIRIASWSSSTTVAEARLRLRVKARPRLQIRPQRADVAERVRFITRLHGPRADRKRVRLQVKQGERWRLFRVGRTNRRGVFVKRFRFRAIEGAARFAFRARVPRQRGYPYAAGRSRKQEVVVSG